LPNGTKKWYVNGLLHREDGPAIELLNGDKKWYVNGLLYREDGPAIERANGDKEWYVHGIKYTEAEFKDVINNLKTRSEYREALKCI